jgi:hypothetical protein
MTGIIAGAYTTFARVAIDSYFGTAAGDESARGLKLFVLPHGSIDAGSGEGESEPPAQARAGATATKRRTPRQKSEPRTSPPGRRE